MPFLGPESKFSRDGCCMTWDVTATVYLSTYSVHYIDTEGLSMMIVGGGGGKLCTFIQQDLQNKERKQFLTKTIISAFKKCKNVFLSYKKSMHEIFSILFLFLGLLRVCCPSRVFTLCTLHYLAGCRDANPSCCDRSQMCYQWATHVLDKRWTVVFIRVLT